MAKEGTPGMCECGFDWKAKTYDKGSFEGTWVQEGGSPMCCGKALVTSHCMCYTCVWSLSHGESNL